MKTLPNKNELNIMWTVATSCSLESGTPAHHGFAKMLYDYLIDTAPPVELYDYTKDYRFNND